MRSPGGVGVAALAERVTALAQRFARELVASGRPEVLNDIVFNQVLVRWVPPTRVDADAFSDAVVTAIRDDGTAYVSPTTWHGLRSQTGGA